MILPPKGVLKGLGAAEYAEFTDDWSKSPMATMYWDLGTGLGLRIEIKLLRAKPPAQSQAEHHCHVAEALLQMRAPQLSQALSHFQAALELEPENARARDGVNSLMSRSLQDYATPASTSLPPQPGNTVTVS